MAVAVRQAGFVTASYRSDLHKMGDTLIGAVEDMMTLAKWSSANRAEADKIKNKDKK